MSVETETMVSVDANINITIEIPQSEIDCLKEEATDEDGVLDEDEFAYNLDQYINDNIDLTFYFGDAWICDVLDSSIM